MFRRVAYLAGIPVIVAVLAGCAGLGLYAFQPRAAWRDQEERACMADRNELAFVGYTPLQRIKGRGACGILAPIKVAVVDGGSVAITPNPTIGCPLAAALSAWVTEAVQPAALAWFGVPVVELNELDAYSCRTVDDIPGGSLSEHAFGNAIDIAGFKLADGRSVTVKKDFRFGEARARGFLHEIYAVACARFRTALGPGEPYHEDHFHLDLAHHNQDGTAQYCNPKPDVVVPDRTPYNGPAVAAGPYSPGNRVVVQGQFDPRAVGSVPLTTR
jgi:hypothetical protein